MKGLLSIPILIGNREHKHTRYNKLEKTTDSRKTLTGCGLFSFLQINLSYITDETKFLKMGTVTLCIQQSLLCCQSCYTLMDWHWQTIYGIDACFLRFHDIQLLSIPSASLQ